MTEPQKPVDSLFKPLWARVGAMLLAITWAVIEAQQGSWVWTVIAGGMVILAAWMVIYGPGEDEA
ncbi:MAG: hypothetical protein ACE366_16100 [Bradymonadia bacterium]